MSEAETGVFILEVWLDVGQGEPEVEYWVCGTSGGSTYAATSGIAGEIAGFFDRWIRGHLSPDVAARHRGRTPFITAHVTIKSQHGDAGMVVGVEMPTHPDRFMAVDARLEPRARLVDTEEEALQGIDGYSGGSAPPI